MNASSIELAVRAFARGGDERSPELLEPVLHPAFRVATFMKGGEGLVILDRDQYLGLIRAGKIGGSPREVTIRSLEVGSEHQAVVQAELVGEHARFHCAFHLVMGNTGWQILHDFPVHEPIGEARALPNLG